MGAVTSSEPRLVGQGLYTIAEASRLTGVPHRRIRRWTEGYTYRRAGKTYHSDPVIPSFLEPIDNSYAINFASLIEVRFVNAFKDYGVKWKAIRIAAHRAKELLGRHHPFSTNMFRTDGRTIMADIVEESGDKHLLDLVKDQFEFEKVVSPYLYEGIDYDELSEPGRWWPLGKDRTVAIDPERAFGAPIIFEAGIPTVILSRAFEAEQSTDFVARWFDVSSQAVEDAVAFESRLAA